MPTTREDKVAAFLYKHILRRFGAPKEIVSDQGSQFMSAMMEAFMQKFRMTHRKSTSYHPQAIGQVEVTNRELENILIKTISLRKSDWSERLDEVVWAYNTTWKTSMGFFPYELVYGKTLVIPIEFEFQKLRMTLEVGILI